MPTTSRATILIVDDDPDIRDVLTLSLKQIGFDILSASDGLAAIDLLRGQAPDLMLLDIDMPRLNGIQVLSWLDQQSTHKQMPIIIMSTYKSLDNPHIKLSGVVDYMVKGSFSHKELHQRIVEILNAHG